MPTTPVHSLHCGKCRSIKLTKAGKRWRGGRKVQFYQCQACGHFQTGGK